MPYLAKYQHDVFVSYARGPTPPGFPGNEADRLGKWSRQLIEDLRYEILTDLGIKDPNRLADIWIDAQLSGDQPITHTLKAKVDNAGLLLIVMSDLFLATNWCLEEVEWFRQACERRGESTDGRIFLVHALPTDEGRWPVYLRGARQYRFHAGDSARPYGWRNAPAGPEYDDSLKAIVADVIGQMRGMEPAEQGASIFLGCMHDTLDEERDELRRLLTAAGIRVLPPVSDDAVDNESLQAALDCHLRDADGLVLIANQYRGAWPKDEAGGFISLQLQKARSLNKTCHLWLQVDDLGKVRRPEYRDCLEGLAKDAQDRGLTIRHDGLSAFADFIVENAKSSPKPPIGVQDAVICANRSEDKTIGTSFLETVVEALSEFRHEAFTFDFGDPKEQQIMLSNMAKRIRNADTLLVLCFDQNWDWARDFLRLLNGISHVRADGKVRLLVAGPRDRHEGRYDARALGFATLDGVDKDARELKELLRQAMQTSARSRAWQGEERRA